MAVIELNAVYTLTGPDGTTAVFNSSSNASYVGAITELTGLDSPDVRENADDLVQMDGGVHGDFFYGRRPITMSGTVLNPVTVSERNDRLNRLSRASDALRADAVLDWTPKGGVRSMLRLRRQQPLRVTGAWQKAFQLAMVASDPRIYSYNLNTTTVPASTTTPNTGRPYDRAYSVDYGPATPNGAITATNAGTCLTYPMLTITGPGTNPTIFNATTGEQIALTYSLAAGEALVVDTLNRTVRLNGTADRYGAVNFLNTSWWGLVPGDNDVRVAFSSFSAGASLQVDWRDAWL